MNQNAKRGLGERLALLFKGKAPLDDPYRHYRKRLTKAIGKEHAAIVRALVDETARYKDGVAGHGFRVRFKDSLEQIHRLTGRFIREDYEDAQRVYRPTVLALVVSGSTRAHEQLFTIDKIISYLAAEFEVRGHRPITAAEISESTSMPLTEVNEALGYVREMSLGGGGTGIPDEPDWHFSPSETLLQKPDLDAVLAQHTEWAVRDARAARKGIPAFYEAQIEPQNRRTGLTSWIGRHKFISFFIAPATILLAVLTFLVDAASVLLKAVELLKALNWL